MRMRRSITRREAWLLLVLLPLFCLASSWAISLAIPQPPRGSFDVVGWEMRHIPGKWLYLTERFFTGGLSAEEEDARLGRFLVLSLHIRRLERDSPGGASEELDELRRERDALEEDVEAIIEGRLTAVLEDAGLESSFPLFPGARWVFPPVDFEVDYPPTVLSVSPRDRIELVDGRPLEHGTTLEDAERLETEIESDGRSSALVETIGGVATYPSMVSPPGNYELLVELVAHEWVHHYLSFKPLGQRYLSSIELRTLNETVAGLAGQELAALVVARYPLPPAIAAEIDSERSFGPPIDVDGTLRALRLEVEDLLGDGQIEAAEAAMEEGRRELAEQGFFFRRINQAFFAFRNLYADTGASIDPLGPKLKALLEESGSAGTFLREAAQLTGAEDLDLLLAGGS